MARLLIITLMLAAAGCLAPPPLAAAPDDVAPADADEEPARDADAEMPSEEDDEAPGEPPGPFVDPGWPALEDATIRPGVQVQWLLWEDEGEPVEVLSSCTANFVFRSPDNASLFLGIAAHCLLPDQSVGEPVVIDKGAASGTVWYNSWATLADQGVQDEESLSRNDFALILIDDVHRHKVHPAVHRYGGPTASSDPTAVAAGDGILFYGNSDLRQGVEPTNWHEGCVVEADGQVLKGRFWHPAVPADSGSPALTWAGEALGVVVDIEWAPQREPRPHNGILFLDPLLSFAAEHAGVEVELVTWPVLERPVLPVPPLC